MYKKSDSWNLFRQAHASRKQHREVVDARAEDLRCELRTALEHAGEIARSVVKKGLIYQLTWVVEPDEFVFQLQPHGKERWHLTLEDAPHPYRVVEFFYVEGPDRWCWIEASVSAVRAVLPSKAREMRELQHAVMYLLGW